MTLYHYTSKFNALHIAENHTIRPISQLNDNKQWFKSKPAWVREGFGLAWFTDLDMALPGILGLDLHQNWNTRTEVRFTVADETNCVWWINYRKHAHPQLVDMIERPGTLPAHFWVSTQPVPVNPLTTESN